MFAEAYLISVGKLPSYMPMPYFLITTQNQSFRPQAIYIASPLASIPTPTQQFLLTLPIPRAPLALPTPPQLGMNQEVASSNEIQELKMLCKNMANQITILSRYNNAKRYPYPIVEKAQHVLVENLDQDSSSR